MSRPRIYMSDHEITRRWNHRSLSDRQMVICLAELNNCLRAEMQDKLESLGLIAKKGAEAHG